MFENQGVVEEVEKVFDEVLLFLVFDSCNSQKIVSH